MRLLLLAVIALPLLAETKVFRSNKHDVASYQTFYWEGPPRAMNEQGEHADSELIPLVRDEVTRQLIARGYREVPSGGDLHVVAGVVAARSNQLLGYLVTFGFDAYWGAWFGMPYPVNVMNREGLLFVGLVDAKEKEGVWAGYDSEAIDRVPDPDTAKKKLTKASGKLLKKLPARKK
jgi:hypothetical protein